MKKRKSRKNSLKSKSTDRVSFTPENINNLAPATPIEPPPPIKTAPRQPSLPIPPVQEQQTIEVQSKTTMLFAAFFLGGIGLHRLLMGYKNWWLMLLTLGGFGIWSLIDFIKIYLGKLPMANGMPLND